MLGRRFGTYACRKAELQCLENTPRQRIDADARIYLAILFRIVERITERSHNSFDTLTDIAIAARVKRCTLDNGIEHQAAEALCKTPGDNRFGIHAEFGSKRALLDAALQPYDD